MVENERPQSPKPVAVPNSASLEAKLGVSAVELLDAKLPIGTVLPQLRFDATNLAEGRHDLTPHGHDLLAGSDHDGVDPVGVPLLQQATRANQQTLLEPASSVRVLEEGLP